MIKILIGDDEKHYAEELMRYLDFNGYDVTFVATGDAVLEKLEEENSAFDVILLNVLMSWGENPHNISTIDLKSGADCGIKLCEIIRKEKDLSMPIIILSILPVDEIGAIYRLGDITYMQRNSSHEDVLVHIKQSLHKKHYYY